MTEKELKAAAIDYCVGRYDFAEHGKAMCLGTTRGFVKMMSRIVTGEILGATVIGPQASELIHEVIVAMTFMLRSNNSCVFRTCIQRCPRSGPIRPKSARCNAVCVSPSIR